MLLALWASSMVSLPARADLDERAAVERICSLGPERELALAHAARGSAAVRAARVLKNPSLVVEHQRILSGFEEHETVVGLSVPIALGGRRGALADAARERQREARSVADAELFAAALEFRRQFAAAAHDAARVKVIERHQQDLALLSSVIEGLARGGERSSYDSLKQRAQLRSHESDLAQARARAAGSRASVQSWLGASVSLPSLAELERATRTKLGADRPSAEHPLLTGLSASSRASALEAKAARRSWFPEIELFGGYRQLVTDAGSGHGVSLGATIPLTFFDHGQGQTGQAEAEVALSRAQHRRARLELDRAGESARRRLTELERSLTASSEALRLSAQVRDQARRLYAAGEAGIIEVLDAYRSLEQVELARIDAIERIALARLDAMQARGSQLDQRLDRACSAKGRK